MTTTFEPTRYGPVLAALLADAPTNDLGPGEPVASRRPELARLTVENAFAATAVVDQAMAACCLAAVWLRWDFLAEGHAICQGIETREGSYWHAVMHRREPDYANSKYWFRRVGDHPVYDELADEAASLASEAGVDVRPLSLGRWDPAAMVDLCEQEYQSGSRLEALLQAVQRREFELLFDHCYHRAVGESD